MDRRQMLNQLAGLELSARCLSRTQQRQELVLDENLDSSSRRVHLAQARAERLTAVLQFIREPYKFLGDDVPGANHHYMTNDAYDSLFKKDPLEGGPWVDTHFSGFTPISSPELDLSGDAGSKMIPIRVDIVVLSPPGEHPYRFWRDSSVPSRMWVADFLPKEGFDKARISIFGTGEGSGHKAVKMFHDGVGKFREGIGSHVPLILVEFAQREAEPLATKIRGSNNHRTARVGSVLVFAKEDSQRPGMPDSHCEVVESEDKRTHQFGSNCNPVYRSIVDAIWKLFHNLSFPDPRPKQEAPPAREEPTKPFHSTSFPNPGRKQEVPPVREEPMKLLDDAIRLVSENPINQEGSGSRELQESESFIAIVQTGCCKHWLQGKGKSSDALSVECSNPDPQVFCESLGAYIRHRFDYRILHLDMRQFDKSKGFVSPIILAMTRFLLWTLQNSDRRTALKQDRRSSIEPNQVMRLIRRIISRSTSGRIQGTEVLGEDLLAAAEDLGSNLVKVVTTADYLFKIECWPSPPIQIAVLVSGLDCVRDPPEMGRIIHCVRDFQERIMSKRHLNFKVLFAQKHSRELRGFLSGIPCISEAEQKDCLNSLRITDSLHPKPINNKHEGTLDWFWKDDKCQKWVAEENSAVLCLLGKPACGKSVLSKFIAETLQPAPNMQLEAGVRRKETAVSFFFDSDQPKLRSRSTMLQQVLYSLLEQKPSFFPCFQEAFQKLKGPEPDSNVVWHVDDLEAVLVEIGNYRPYSRPQGVYIVIDGLDEACDEAVACAKSLAKAIFQDKGGDSKPNIAGCGVCFKLLVATQEGACVEQLKYPVKARPTPYYELRHQEQNKADILEYAKSFLDDELIRRFEWTEDEVRECRDILVKQSCGIFLWAKLAKGLIEDDFFSSKEPATPAGFKEFLTRIPPDISDLYSRLLKRLENWAGSDRDRTDRIRRILEITVYSKCPLSLAEFLDFFIWRDEKRQELFRNLKSHRPNFDNLTSIIAEHTKNLVEVHDHHTKYRRNKYEKGKRCIVRMLHPTATAFLDSHKTSLLPGPGLGLSVLALGCIRFLELASQKLDEAAGSRTSKFKWPENLNEFNEYAKIINEYPVLDYALRHLTEHLDLAQLDHQRELSKLLDNLCKGPIRWLLADWIVNRKTDLERHGVVLQSEENWSISQWLNWRKEQKRGSIQTFKNSVLHCAAASGLGLAVKVALFAGAQVDSPSELHKNGERAICLAITESPSQQTRDVVSILIEGKANLKLPTFFGGTPLHYAGKFGKDDTVELLIQHGINVEAPDNQERTALHRAVIGNLPDPADRQGTDPARRKVSAGSVERLLRAGADPCATDKDGLTPIHWAAGCSDQVEILKILIQSQVGKDAESPYSLANQPCRYQDSTPLHWASSHDRRKNVRYLLENGARPDALDSRDKSAVNWAARYGNIEVLDNHLKYREAKQVVDMADRGGATPLIWACRWGHERCVELLIAEGAKVNPTDAVGGATPLIWACRWGRTGCAQLLIEKGADVNHQDKDGGMPISWAVTYGHLDTIKLLLKHGVSMQTPDKCRPLLGWAAGSGNLEMFKDIRRLAEERNEELNPDEPDGGGNTPFMLAAKRNHMEIIKYLYERRDIKFFEINIDHINKEGSNAVHLAASGGHLDVVRWLVEEAGLKADGVNEDGDTVLHCAAKQGRSPVIAFLRSFVGQIAEYVNSRGKLYTELLREYFIERTC